MVPDDVDAPPVRLRAAVARVVRFLGLVAVVAAVLAVLTEIDPWLDLVVGLAALFMIVLWVSAQAATHNRPPRHTHAGPVSRRLGAYTPITYRPPLCRCGHSLYVHAHGEGCTHRTPSVVDPTDPPAPCWCEETPPAWLEPLR